VLEYEDGLYRRQEARVMMGVSRRTVASISMISPHKRILIDQRRRCFGGARAHV
jgi:hypothetical protein